MPKPQTPPGREIAEQAKRIRLEKDRTASAKFQGKKGRFTPARLDRAKSLDDLARGAVVGRLDTEFAGDETDLPPGQYNLYLRRADDGSWEGFAEADGEVVAKAARVTIQEDPSRKGPAKDAPEFSAKGWCWCWWWNHWLICYCW